MVTKVLTLNQWPGAREAASGERPETLQINAPQPNSAMPGTPVTRKLRANRYAMTSAGKVASRRLSAIRSPRELMRRLNILEPQADHGHEQDRQQKPGETMWTEPRHFIPSSIVNTGQMANSLLASRPFA